MAFSMAGCLGLPRGVSAGAGGAASSGGSSSLLRPRPILLGGRRGAASAPCVAVCCYDRAAALACLLRCGLLWPKMGSSACVWGSCASGTREQQPRAQIRASLSNSASELPRLAVRTRDGSRCKSRNEEECLGGSAPVDWADAAPRRPRRGPRTSALTPTWTTPVGPKEATARRRRRRRARHQWPGGGNRNRGDGARPRADL